MSRPMRRPDPAPMKTNDSLVIGVGTAIWAAVAVSLIAILSTLHSTGNTWWLQCALIGTGLGLIGLGMLQHRDRTAARRQAPQARRR